MQLGIEPVTLKNQVPCKNHPNIPSGYYLSDQPAIRYCKNCALNVALCGRKIQKELTPEEHQQKNHITSFVKQLSQNKENIKISQTIYTQLEQYLHEVAKIMENKLNDVDNSINELVSYREMLVARYEEDVVRQLQKFKEIREKSVSNEEQILKVLERIESNFGNFIELQHSELLQTEEKLWNQTLVKSKDSIAYQSYYQQTKNNLTKNTSEFMEICGKIADFRVYFSNMFITQFDSNKQNSQISDINSLESSNLVEQLKINLAANAQSKKRDNNHKKSVTDRDNQILTKKMNKRNVNQIQQHSDCVVPVKRSNH